MTEANSAPRQPRQPVAPPGQPPPVLKRWDNIVKSSDDKREYRGLELSNHMKVLLVSDPAADRSAAALDVNVGYMSDPKDMPGLAHFCEHMLFLGTEKYPEENEYSKFLSDHGGSSNAATSADHTMYYFDILPNHLPGALDMFAQFFIAPLFTETSTKREILAVNSEHMKNLKSDIWRIDQVNKHTADPDHDYNCFGTGNKATLGSIPRKRGINTRDELLKFHDKWYSANLMCLCVFGKESLDELEEMIVPLFSSVPNWDAPKPTWTKHPFPPERCRKLLYITPIKDSRSLSVDFPIPDTRKYYKNGPAHYLSHVLGHEGPGSLLSLLKSHGWCNSLVGGTRIGARGFGFFGVHVDLTEEGLQNIDNIVEAIFQYIAMLKEHGIQRWIWEEQRDLMYMDFRFKDSMDPRALVTNHVHHMQDFPMEDVLSVYFILSEYKPHLIEEIMSMLSPDNVRIAVIAKKFKSLCTEREPWYGTKYTITDIPEDTLDDWRKAKPHPNLHLPFPNEFIPTNFEIYNPYDPTKDHLPPYIIRDSHTVRTWFKPDSHYQLPKAILTFDFVTPLAYSDPLNCNLTSVWVLLLRDSLQECAYAAELAGLRWHIYNAKNGITITIDGYDDKQLILLEKMVRELVHFKTDPARLAIMKENHIRSIKNFEAEQPYQHAVYEQALCLTDNVWSKGQLLEAAELINAERLDDYARHFIRKVHVEGLVFGNFTKERALQVASIIEDTLPEDGMPLLSQQLMLSREVEMEKGTEYVRQVYNEIHKSSCTTVYYDCGLRNTRSNVALELTVQLLSEPCFNILRTQEQLGYIVFVGIRRSHGVQGLRFIIQGDKHPAYLEERIEAFLKDMENYIQSLPEEEFHKHRGSLIASRLEKPKRMSQKASQLWGEIASQPGAPFFVHNKFVPTETGKSDIGTETTELGATLYHFNRAQVEADHLSSMTKADFLEYYWRHFASNSAHRKKLAVHVISMAEGGAGYIAKHGPAPDQEADWLPIPGSPKRWIVITDLLDFKSRSKLYPHLVPYTNIPRKGQHSKL